MVAILFAMVMIEISCGGKYTPEPDNSLRALQCPPVEKTVSYDEIEYVGTKGSGRLEYTDLRDSLKSACMNCHQNSVHAVNSMKENEQPAKTMTVKNCIDCHMPLQPSKTIYFNSSAGLKNIPYLLRTHKIAIYK